MKNVLYILIVTIFLLLGCSTPNYVNSSNVSNYDCAYKSDWNGIIVGKSNILDVLRTIGIPSDVIIQKIDSQVVVSFGYPVSKGLIKNYLKDWIFFNIDGSVSWMIKVRGDRDNRTQTIADITRPLGNIVDIVYTNNNYNPSIKQYDVLTGPDQVYVLSNCGIALLALPYCQVQSETGQVICGSAKKDYTVENNHEKLSVVYEQEQQDTSVSLDTNALLISEFVFPPTTFDEFLMKYRYKVPYYGWTITEGIINDFSNPK